MIREYLKGARLPLGEKGRFTTADFDCHCTRPTCKSTLVCDLLVESLEEFWEIVGPFGIDSGFRCDAHNAEIHGAKESRHTKGDAADCKSKTGLRGNLMARQAEGVKGFREGGIGIYPTFCHADTRGYRARWSLGVPC